MSMRGRPREHSSPYPPYYRQSYGSVFHVKRRGVDPPRRGAHAIMDGYCVTDRRIVAACRALRGKVEGRPVDVPDRARPLLRCLGGKRPDYSTIGRQWRRALLEARVKGEPLKPLQHYKMGTTRVYLRGRGMEVVWPDHG